MTMLETGINIIDWPSLQYCTMSAFGGDAWQRKAMSHKSSFIIIIDNIIWYVLKKIASLVSKFFIHDMMIGAVKIENEICAFQDIKRGLQQGCVLNSETILRELEDMPGLKLRYAEDTALIAENQKDLQNLLNVVKNESRKKGLHLNSKKTEVMVIIKKTPPECNIFVDGTKLKTKAILQISRHTHHTRWQKPLRSKYKKLPKQKLYFKKMKI